MRGTSASDRRSTALSRYLGVLALASVTALGLASNPAFAQSNAGDKRAFQLFQEGDELYKQGNFAEAAEKFRAAYALDPNPTLLYNLARSYENLGELDQAADTYREYLQRQPDATDRGAIERRIETLEQQLEEKRALERAAKQKPEPTAPPAERAPEPEQTGPGALPWVVVGVGGAALIAGGVLRLMAEQKHASAEDDGDASSAQDKQENAESLAEVSGITLIAGAVVGAVGVSWLLLGSDSEKAARSPSLGLFAGPGTISLEGRF